MKRNASISDLLKPISEVPHQAYLSNLVQVADVLEWILEQVGPAEVWQTSFSISEEFLRRLYFIEQRKDVKFHLVLDHKATNKTLKLWVFIQQVIESTVLADNHSKILLVEAQNGQRISVVTSQNLTRGNRFESTFITSDCAIFDRLKSDVLDLIKSRSVPLSELMAQTLSE